MLYYTKILDVCPWNNTVVKIAKGIGPVNDYLFSQSNHCELGLGAYSFSCLKIINTAYLDLSGCVNEPFSLKENIETKPNITYTTTGIIVNCSKPITGTILIYNIWGGIIHKAQLYDQRSFEYNTNQLAKGIYAFGISVGNGKHLSGKFIVE